MSNINELSNIPDISFIDGLSLENIQNELLEDYIAKYKEVTGNSITLAASDPARLILLAAAQQFYQLYAYIDRAGKMNMLKYSKGDYLDNLGAFKGLARKEASFATVMVEFSMNAIRTSATGIPGGTRVTDKAGNMFATDEYVEIPAGGYGVTVSAMAVSSGSDVNGIAIGEINEMVDVVPYISTVTNTTVSAGGSGRQTDDDYTRDIYNAPSGYSVAGPEDAYDFHALRSRSDVEDVKTVSPEPMHIDVYFSLADGKLPTTEDCAAMEEYLNDETIRPLGDRVQAKSPGTVEYSIEFTYYINRSDSNKAVSIQQAVDKAVSEYLIWQRKLGRDINPSELIRRVVVAGAKRIELLQPGFTRITDTEVSVIKDVTINYGGLEDD